MNDTRLAKNKRLKIKGYKTVRKDHPSGKSVAGGVAMLVKNGVKFHEISNNMKEMITIEIVNNQHKMIISTVYLHPGELLTQQHFDAINRNVSANAINTTCVIIGDLNAHCGIDRRGKTDRAGNIVNNLIVTNNYVIMNDDSPTYLSASKNTSSCIDLCLVRSTNGSKLHWQTGENYGSDHLVTSLSIDCKYKAESIVISKTNWANVRLDLEQTKPVIRGCSALEIEDSIESLSHSIRQSIDANTTNRKLMTRNEIALSAETREIIVFRRKLNKLRKYLDATGKPSDLTRKLMNSLNREIKRLIKRDVEKTTLSKIESISNEKDSARAWRQLKDMEPDIGKGKEDAGSMGIEDTNGILQKDEAIVAQIHADRLANSHSFPSDPKFDESFRNEIDQEVDHLPTDITDFGRVSETLKNASLDDFMETERVGRFGRKIPPLIHDQKITANEIYHHLRKKKNRSAGGADGVTYKALKHSGKNVICGLAKLFTILLVAGYFPMNWRAVRISMIPKAGKDLKHAKNWRPISLSSSMSKLYECCIKERLEKEMSKRKIKENHFQAAYKKGRNCQEHILRLSENVTHGFAKQESTVAVFLDVAGAFDKVWVNGLLWKIMKMQLPKYLVGNIKGFLSDRELQVRVGTKFSQVIKMRAGTPQGAMLSPSLFNIFVDDLRDIIGLDKEVMLAQYADDIAIWTTDADPKVAEKRINDSLEKIANWTSKWRIKLAPEKSVSMLFSRRPTHRRQNLNLKLFGSDIKRVSSHKFLGAQFDDKLDWKCHVTQMLAKSTPRIYAIKRIAAKSQWRNINWILRLHESVVGSIWKYAAIGYANMGQHLWDGINKVHARCIKSYVGVPNYASYYTVCRLLGLQTAKDELLAFGRKRLFAIIAFSPFGPGIIQNRRQNVQGSYKSISETLIDDAEISTTLFSPDLD